MYLPPPPTQRPTLSEFSVIAILFSVLFIVLGGIVLFLGFRAPPEKHDLASKAIGYGTIAILVGVIFLLVFWLVRRLIK